jgi:hypothetical protein
MQRVNVIVRNSASTSPSKQAAHPSISISTIGEEETQARIIVGEEETQATIVVLMDFKVWQPVKACGQLESPAVNPGTFFSLLEDWRGLRPAGTLVHATVYNLGESLPLIRPRQHTAAAFVLLRQMITRQACRVRVTTTTSK